MSRVDIDTLTAAAQMDAIGDGPRDRDVCHRCRKTEYMAGARHGCAECREAVRQAAEEIAKTMPKTPRKMRYCACGFESDWPPAFSRHMQGKNALVHFETKQPAGTQSAQAGADAALAAAGHAFDPVHGPSTPEKKPQTEVDAKQADKGCYDCKHVDVSYHQEPCHDCDDLSAWEPQEATEKALEADGKTEPSVVPLTPEEMEAIGAVRSGVIELAAAYEVASESLDLKREIIDTRLRLIGAMCEARHLPASFRVAVEDEIDRIRDLVGEVLA